ncbi:MAG: tetratricopeptide repeat protein, partial [Tepidisphaeraceae bacterium]
MSSRPASTSISQLWQVPLLAVSVGLFGYDAYLLWDPKPGPTVEQQLLVARQYLDAERPEAAVEQLNRIIKLDKLTPEQQARTHLLFAEGLEQFQAVKHLTIPALQMRVIEQTRYALALGKQIDGPSYRRLGEAYESIGKPDEALSSYKKSERIDPQHSLRLARKIIELELDGSNTAAADAELQDYLKMPGLSDAERCWALGERAQVQTDLGNFVDARVLLDQALKLSADPMQEAEIDYRIGYVAYHVGQMDEAERYLRAAREQFRGRHPLDADASLLLGKIAQSRNQPAVAMTFYQNILTNFPEAKSRPLATLGLGLCRAMQKQDDAALEDMISVAKEVDQRDRLASLRPEVITGLKQAGDLLGGHGNYQGQIELAAYEQMLRQTPTAEFFSRLAGVYGRRADQLEQAAADADPAERIKDEQQVRDLRTKAGDCYVAFSQKQTLTDDKGYADSLWQGVEMYERAANTPAAISALELFVAQRPSDPMTPDAMLRLGRAYQAQGQLDKAIAVYQRNQVTYPKSLAASKSAIPLAQAFIAQGPGSFDKARAVLDSVLDNNLMLDPASNEFRQALYEIGQLDYRTGHYPEAISRFSEFSKRYPQDDHLGQVLFMMGESHRRVAESLEKQIADAKAGSGHVAEIADMQNSRKERLSDAKTLYDRVVDLYSQTAPSTDTEKLYYKLANFYRADCLYDLGQYQDAITLYDKAAFRFHDDPSSLAANVQIVNAWCKLGRPDQAKAANERAKWLLRRIPPEAFGDGSFTMPKAYWEQWLKWSNESG